jgi:hypothetical protein
MTGDGRWLEYAMDVVRGTAIGDVAEDDEGFNRFKSHAAASLVVAQAIEAYGDKMVRAIGDHTESVKALTKAVYWLGLGDPDKPTATGALEYVAQQIGEVAGAIRDRK